MNESYDVQVIGGGLAGCEAAWQAAERGLRVVLYEMRPLRFSPAHETELLAELVCSNSLRSDSVDSAVGLLKEEMRRFDSLIMQAADATSVPAGSALAVDRAKFSNHISGAIEAHPNITVIRQEVIELPPSDIPVILATGPLTSEAMTNALVELTGEKHLAFYDAIAPIVDAESLNRDIIYRKSRWDDDNPGDYLNCPMDETQYRTFIDMLINGDSVPAKEFEKPKYFEGCLPVEVMAERGVDTLRYGPMKPVGLAHPKTGTIAHAVIQLRAENLQKSMYNLVGFQTRLTYPEQKRIFKTIPGLENVEFVRLGSIHRNTFICAPLLLNAHLQLKNNSNIYLAGQLSGVEGYVESTAMGLLAGFNAARVCLNKELIPPPSTTAFGALIKHLTETDPDCFQPSNVNFGLFPAWEKKVPKKLRGEKRKEISDGAMKDWLEQLL